MRPPPPAPKAAMPEPVEETVMARFFTIFFDFDSSSLNPTAQRVVEAILADWGKWLRTGQPGRSYGFLGIRRLQSEALRASGNQRSRCPGKRRLGHRPLVRPGCW